MLSALVEQTRTAICEIERLLKARQRHAPAPLCEQDKSATFSSVALNHRAETGTGADASFAPGCFEIRP